MANISPCSLSIQDDEIDVSRFNSADPTFCRLCGSRTDERNIILYDDYNDGYHIYCLRPPLTSVPPGQWLCQHHQDDGAPNTQLFHKNSTAWGGGVRAAELYSIYHRHLPQDQ